MTHITIQKRTCSFLLAAMGCFAISLLFASTTYAADAVSAAYYLDADFDGTVDHAVLIFDEDIDQCLFEADDWSIDVAGSVGVTAITGINTDSPEGMGLGTCDGSDDRVYLSLTTTADITGGAVSPVISYTNQGVAGSLSGVTTAQISDKAAQTFVDWAAPVVLSVTPGEDSTNQNRNINIQMVFSEIMVTTFEEGTQFEISPDPGSFSASWSVGNTVLALETPKLRCRTTYTVTTDAGEIEAAAGSSRLLADIADLTGDWSFTTGSSGCSRGVTEPEQPSVELLSPDGAEQMNAGDTQMITWNSGREGTHANIWYSIDGGENYVAIVQSTQNDGVYEWVVPHVNTQESLIKIEITDLVHSMASDTSDAFFTIRSSQTPPVSETESLEDMGTRPESVGISPITGQVQRIDEVMAGTYISGMSFDTVYYVDSEFIRHPFMDTRTFFTWQSDFSNVKEVTDATLASLKMGAPMLPKPGAVLVKIQSDASVYLVAENEENMFAPILRKIDSETVAERLFGANWAGLVIDLPITLLRRYMLGSVVE